MLDNIFTWGITGAAAMTGAIAGLILGLVSWLVYAAVGYGGVNQDALFEVCPDY